jgi:hypothetical protein
VILDVYEKCDIEKVWMSGVTGEDKIRNKYVKGSIGVNGVFNINAPRGKIIFPPFPLKNIYIYINKFKVKQ